MVLQNKLTFENAYVVLQKNVVNENKRKTECIAALKRGTGSRKHAEK